jgi:hypothetical protein
MFLHVLDRVWVLTIDTAPHNIGAIRSLSSQELRAIVGTQRKKIPAQEILSEFLLAWP